MQSRNYSRRTFIKQQSLMGLGIAMVPAAFCSISGKEATIHCISPIDGDILHAHDGTVTGESLQTTITVKAPENHKIFINGIKASSNKDVYAATVPLNGLINTIEIRDRTSGDRKDIKIYWLSQLAGKYRLSIDDAVWFLKDIHQHAASYHSIFDSPFLGFLKQLHDSYGTKVHINLFYETEGFDLSQMTDKYKAEWQANAAWLRLSFHAKAEFPDNPYRNAGYQQVKQECGAVMREIKRFAGDELNDMVTTLHWGETPVEVSRALRDIGYTAQLCDFNVDNDLAPCSYYLTVPQRRHMQKRFVWRDNEENITFIKSSIIIDTKKISEIVPYLEQYEKENRKPPYVDLLVHEQYFYDYYNNYQPDYRDKVETAVKWAVANGYTPASIHECLNI